MTRLDVQGKEITLIKKLSEDYLSLTDIARYRNPDTPADVVKNWMRNRGTVDYLGLWEKLNNPDFKLVEFDQFHVEAGSNYFVLSPQKWIEKTNAIGMISKSGQNGGTFAHSDIAFEFTSWISPEFKLYMIIEFQRLKDNEQKQLGWDLKRNLTKINYRIHTDAIKENLIPPVITREQANFIFANEADLLNMALFGMTAKTWREKNPHIKGNIRDFATVSQLVCLANLENLNAIFIQDGLSQSDRLERLNKIAIHQMKLLSTDSGIKKLEGGK